MRFRTADMDTFLQSTDYVDTALIPLIKGTWSEQAKTVVQAGEFIQLLTDELERQFRGRMMQFPAISYTESEAIDAIMLRIHMWVADLRKMGFKHLFLMTADGEWRFLENDQFTLFYVPSLPLEYIDQKNRKKIMDDQLQQLLPTITRLWQEKE